jgi:hypothetical protein
VIGELLAAVCSDREVLARIGGRIGQAARAAAGELARLDTDEGRATRARIVAAARAPVPPGIRGVHASWIEAGLAELPDRARHALAQRSLEPVDVWLARWACAELPPLPPVDPVLRAPRSLDEAIRLSGERLATWLVEVGADQLALALRPAGDNALVAVARTAPRVAIAAERIARPPRAGALGPVRAAIQRCRDAPPRDDGLLVIGARSIAPHIDPIARRQLAVRLARPIGLAVLAELAAHAHAPLADAPAWSALAA